MAQPKGIWTSLLIVALIAPMSMGCARKFKGDARLFSLSECNSRLADAFNVSEESIEASSIGGQITNIRAHADVDDIGPFLTVSFQDHQGVLETYFDEGPVAGWVEESSVGGFRVSYSCLDSDCFRIGLLFNTTASSPSSFSSLSDAPLGVVVQQADNDSSTYVPICYSHQ